MRLVRIFSYIINFIRFRESQTSSIDKHYNKAEVSKQRIETLYHSNQAKEDTLNELERNRKSADAALQTRQARSKELESLLRGLKAEQERVIERLERVKAEQGHLKTVLEDRTMQTMLARQAAAKLRPYTEQSPESLEASLQQLSDSLNVDKAHIETLNKRSRALQTSCEAFSTVQSEVKTCTTLLNELCRDLTAEEATAQAASKNQEALSERSNNVRDVEREEKMLLKQLDNVQKRTEKLRTTAEDRSTAQGRKMEELKTMNDDIKRERAERGREMEKRRVRIEQTEKKVSYDFFLHNTEFAADGLHHCRWQISKKTSKMRSTLHMTNLSGWIHTSASTSGKWSRLAASRFPSACFNRVPLRKCMLCEINISSAK